MAGNQLIMTVDQLVQKRQALMDKQLEVNQRLSTIKDKITRAKREFAAGGKPADPLWLSNQEKYARQLGITSQELQRQLGELRSEQKAVNQSNFVDFLRAVLRERMSLEEVAEIFREARRRSLQSSPAKLPDLAQPELELP
jgi:hypothetical protein